MVDTSPLRTHRSPPTSLSTRFTPEAAASSPRSINVVIKLSDKSFMPPLFSSDDKRHDICVNIFCNGIFLNSQIIEYGQWSAEKHAIDLQYSGIRYDAHCELPLIINSVSQLRDVPVKSANDTNGVLSPSERWSRLAATLATEANEWGRDSRGYRYPTGNYLGMLSKKNMPAELEGLGSSDKSIFAVIDVIVTIGRTSPPIVPKLSSLPSQSPNDNQKEAGQVALCKAKGVVTNTNCSTAGTCLSLTFGQPQGAKRAANGQSGYSHRTHMSLVDSGIPAAPHVVSPMKSYDLTPASAVLPLEKLPQVPTRPVGPMVVPPDQKPGVIRAHPFLPKKIPQKRYRGSGVKVKKPAKRQKMLSGLGEVPYDLNASAAMSTRARRSSSILVGSQSTPKRQRKIFDSQTPPSITSRRRNQRTVKFDPRYSNRPQNLRYKNSKGVWVTPKKNAAGEWEIPPKSIVMGSFDLLTDENAERAQVNLMGAFESARSGLTWKFDDVPAVDESDISHKYLAGPSAPDCSERKSFRIRFFQSKVEDSAMPDNPANKRVTWNAERSNSPEYVPLPGSGKKPFQYPIPSQFDDGTFSVDEIQPVQNGTGKPERAHTPILSAARNIVRSTVHKDFRLNMKIKSAAEKAAATEILKIGTVQDDPSALSDKGHDGSQANTEKKETKSQELLNNTSTSLLDQNAAKDTVVGLDEVQHVRPAGGLGSLPHPKEPQFAINGTIHKATPRKCRGVSSNEAKKPINHPSGSTFNNPFPSSIEDQVKLPMPCASTEAHISWDRINTRSTSPAVPTNRPIAKVTAPSKRSKKNLNKPIAEGVATEPVVTGINHALQVAATKRDILEHTRDINKSEIADGIHISSKGNGIPSTRTPRKISFSSKGTRKNASHGESRLTSAANKGKQVLPRPTIESVIEKVNKLVPHDQKGSQIATTTISSTVDGIPHVLDDAKAFANRSASPLSPIPASRPQLVNDANTTLVTGDILQLGSTSENFSEAVKELNSMIMDIEQSSKDGIDEFRREVDEAISQIGRKTGFLINSVSPTLNRTAFAMPASKPIANTATGSGVKLGEDKDDKASTLSATTRNSNTRKLSLKCDDSFYPSRYGILDGSERDPTAAPVRTSVPSETERYFEACGVLMGVRFVLGV